MNQPYQRELTTEELEMLTVTEILATISTIKFTTADQATEFFKNEITSLAESHHNLFFVRKNETNLKISLGLDTNSPAYIYFLNGFHRQITIKIGEVKSEYKIEIRENGIGFELVEIDYKEDPLQISGIVINDSLKINFVKALKQAIDSWIFKEEEVEEVEEVTVE